MAEFTLGDDVGAQSAATMADESLHAGSRRGVRAELRGRRRRADGLGAITSTDTDFQAPLRALAQSDPDVLYFPIFVAACTS